ncbi:SDR family oxidoreductase [Rhizobium daejeonense]|uniref:SDR family oxidoreductase n=1 Tax=Rhizobium daejeonense TaxID=240521 RepID=A0A6M1SCF6_9HYPH|nr:glucose 1-dehydrogenase [Rhizobium daejeonense]NGO65928.1 SDR family oxidoreductase [Rhizobium daejeonense]
MSDSYLDFDGKVVLITGAATGIGRATALAFADRGARLVIGDLSQAAEETAALAREKGVDAVFVKTNVSQSADVQALVAEAEKRFGRLDIAFNNAGILPSTTAFAETDEAEFDRIIAVDLRGVFLSVKYELQALLRAGGGAIVNTASVAGVVADPNMAPYAAAKHGVVGLTRAAALDYAAKNIRVNAVAPGLIATPMTERWLADPQISKALMANSPIQRAAQPEEIAAAVLFLSSPAASFINGSIFVADGGQTAH